MKKKNCEVCGEVFEMRTNWMKYCNKVCARQRHRLNRRKGSAGHKRHLATQKKHYDSDKGRDTYYRRNYGIGIEDYNEAFAEQEGGCAICGTHQSELAKRLYVDHDHDTGKFRGLLCPPCNTGLGQFRDNTELLANAISYLEENLDEHE